MMPINMQSQHHERTRFTIRFKIQLQPLQVGRKINSSLTSGEENQN